MPIHVTLPSDKVTRRGRKQLFIEMVRAGKSNTEIAAALSVTVHAVVMRKLRMRRAK